MTAIPAPKCHRIFSRPVPNTPQEKVPEGRRRAQIWKTCPVRAAMRQAVVACAYQRLRWREETALPALDQCREGFPVSVVRIWRPQPPQYAARCQGRVRCVGGRTKWGTPQKSPRLTMGEPDKCVDGKSWGNSSPMERHLVEPRFQFAKSPPLDMSVSKTDVGSLRTPIWS